MNIQYLSQGRGQNPGLFCCSFSTNFLKSLLLLNIYFSPCPYYPFAPRPPLKSERTLFYGHSKVGSSPEFTRDNKKGGIVGRPALLVLVPVLALHGVL